MGAVATKERHVSYTPIKVYKSLEIINTLPTKEYSLTFTGHVLFKSPRKSKGILYNSIYEGIVNTNFWHTFIQGAMNESINLIPDFPSVSDLSIVIDEKNKVVQNIISGTIFWKGFSTDIINLGECIAMKMLDNEFNKITIDDQNMEWSYIFIPGSLAT